MPHQYNIQSLGSSSSFVGITSQTHFYAPVQLNPANKIWTVTPKPDDDTSVQLKIGKFMDTGVDSVTGVVASNISAWNEQWYIHPRCNAHTIEILDSNPTVGWTVSGTSDTAPIVIREIDISQCNPSQLFNFVPVAGN